MRIGTTLRDARERRGVSLGEIARQTRVPVHLLEAIERGETKTVPRGIFLRSYLRAYARQVGLDPEQVVSDYRAGLEERPFEESELQKLRDRYANRGRVRRSWRGWVVPAGALAAIIIYRMHAPGVAHAPMTSPEVQLTAGGAPAITVSSVETPSPVRMAGSGSDLSLGIEAAGPCWISVMTDGRQVLEQLMQQGDRATVRARDEIRLRIGDAGAFAYSINGVEGRPVGGPGEVVTIEIRPDNFLQFLSS